MSNDLISQSQDDLSRGVKKALAKLESIIDLPLPDDDTRVKMISIQKDAAASLINAGLKADQNRFRQERQDIVEQLFAKIHKTTKIIDGVLVHKV
jgi:hypothetical protein